MDRDGQLKVVRSVCLFTEKLSEQSVGRLQALSDRLTARGFTVQTTRLCSPDPEGVFKLDRDGDGSILYSVGRVGFPQATGMLEQFCNANNVAFNIDLTNETPAEKHVSLFTAIVQNAPTKTFSFTYTFNNAPSSPYFPSATYETDGFAIGLQPTNLSSGCENLDEWLHRLQDVWAEIDSLMEQEDSYLGIDTSIAPLFKGDGSFLNLLKRIGLEWDRAASSDVFLRISSFLRSASQKSVGLCGLMFPCLEDFELADEYEQGKFTIERCLFLSLHSGLGIDSYPVGVDERSERIAEVLRLVQGLSNKYRKALSARFISDGVARIGERTNLASPYLKDVTVRPL